MAKILVVDDFPELLEVLSVVLQPTGHEVGIMSSNDIVKNSFAAFMPDLILLDVRPYGSDGRQLCKDLKEKSIQNIPIILMSTYPALLKNYQECKADAIIEKPFDIDTLLQTIKEVLRNTEVQQ